jgi:uncharacterized protein DUF6627
MSQRLRNRLIELMMVLVLGLAAALAMPRAYAGMIASDAAIKPSDERAHVKQQLARPELARQLEKMGVAPETAAARIDAMSDAEVRQLAGRLDAIPAGGALSNTDLLIIVIIVLLIIIII